MFRLYHSLLLLGTDHRVLDMRFAVQGIDSAGVWQVIHRPIGHARGRGTMNRMSPRNDVGKAAFVCHVIVLMHRFMVAVGENGQTALRLSCQGSRSAFVIAQSRRRRVLVRIRFWHWIQMLFLEGAGASATMAATAVVCCICHQKLLL